MPALVFDELREGLGDGLLDNAADVGGEMTRVVIMTAGAIDWLNSQWTSVQDRVWDDAHQNAQQHNAVRAKDPRAVTAWEQAR